MCVSECPIGLFADSMSGFCVIGCLKAPTITYGYIPTKTCESTCYGDYPYGNSNEYENLCLSTCPFDSISERQKYGNNSTS